MTTTLTINILN